jgi:molybdopterin-containing oxidoreductase family membrane subunit
MAYTWRIYIPHIEIPLTIGTFALFILLYMLASRLIPLVPVWEVQEGQLAHSLRKFGKTKVATKAEIE